jgi:hypothetical protein
MKKPLLFPVLLMLMASTIMGCGGANQKNNPLKNSELENKLASANETAAAEESGVPEEELKEAVQYESYTYTKSFKEEELEKGPSDVLDFRKRKNDKFIGIKFSDGHSGTLVYRDGFFYNYTIREKTEVRFASKEDGLQRIWDDSRLLQDAGASIANFAMKKAGPRKKDGTPDMRYKANQ